ncbi:acylphosphatase [Aquimarina brevivitae]|uniref:acylphosphatase n=1 Tax=Aquimarina brevivitae TaxID=323412 RepID=A0A4Q7PIM8_9FLAO|nr:acylphosphatase [Aquimarina brevivitae]RZS99670.1 acylphosphatase [Aquimarina brevivitae]
MTKHYNITITGKVQGVWYRKSTKETADQLGLVGYVQNLDNGNVYIEAEGAEAQLNKLVEWCHQGPEFALVADVKKKEDGLKDFTSFEIKR